MQKALIIFISIMVVMIIVELIVAVGGSTPAPSNETNQPVSYLDSTI